MKSLGTFLLLSAGSEIGVGGAAGKQSVVRLSVKVGRMFKGSWLCSSDVRISSELIEMSMSGTEGAVDVGKEGRGGEGGGGVVSAEEVMVQA